MKKEKGENEKGRDKTHGIPSREVAFTKELNGYNEGLGEGAGGSESPPNTVPLRSEERSISIKPRHSSCKAPNVDKMNWTTRVR